MEPESLPKHVQEAFLVIFNWITDATKNTETNEQTENLLECYKEINKSYMVLRDLQGNTLKIKGNALAEERYKALLELVDEQESVSVETKRGQTWLEQVSVYI